MQHQKYFNIDLNSLPSTPNMGFPSPYKWFNCAQLKSEKEATWEMDNGLFYLTNHSHFKIYTDNFGTIPLLFDNKNKCLLPDFQQLGPFNILTKELDIVSFWQCMLYDCPLGHRTLNNNVLQVPGGSIFQYDYSSFDYNITRWNYFKHSTSDYTEDNLLTAIDKRLQSVCQSIWDELPQDGYIILPLSGGLDSRLLAVHLASSGDPTRILAVTFGFSQRSQEYQLAHKVCKELRINQHHFHHLPGDHYIRYANDFWKYWQGCLSVLHSHLYSYLVEHSPQKAILVSGFLGDPIAGYAAEPSLDFAPPLENTKTYEKLDGLLREFKLDNQIAHELIADLRFLYEEWQTGKSSFRFDEYFYFTQRQTKTFSPLLQMYREFCDVAVPFSDPELVNLFLSAPYSLRKEKMITRKLIALRNLNLLKLGDLSSASTTHSAYYRLRGHWRKWVDRCSLMLSVGSDDHCRWLTPYWTENILSARQESRPAILSALAALYDIGILDEYQYNILRKKPFKSFEFSRLFRILTFLPWAKSLNAN